ncbi:hypothetical protein DL764_001573 [Monosporascus ibericus]|uniref:Uncharacterized protein n=1 Tax=Monosporascus ibericus TaxID=155417 RepID=A0A4Q4TQN8_9PEZI|nr:hypothetical protein DL764_001573 [Monosporascus ibericus]
MTNGTTRVSSARVADSSSNSPYSRAGAPSPHPNTDPYAPLRASALSTLKAMGFDPKTIVERGVIWAEDQDPCGHYLSKEEYDGMIHARTVIRAIRNYELDIRRQVKYPDSVRTGALYKVSTRARPC